MGNMFTVAAGVLLAVALLIAVLGVSARVSARLKR